MSLPPPQTSRVPAQTARIAHAACPTGTLCLQLSTPLGTIFAEHPCAALFPRRGQPAAAPCRLALVPGLQCVQGLSDRAAAAAVRGRLDWHYLLGLALAAPGCAHAVCCAWRARLLEPWLARRQAPKLVQARGRRRTDSTAVGAAIRTRHRLERGIATRRAALPRLATVVPVGLQATGPGAWLEREGRRAEAARFPPPAARAAQKA
jgi:transposase